ncbi:MAG: pyrimidine/purine nucleoside phosphorylase [Pseudomonadota bacterium]|nr:pyrimidine/purine nucleoside phosphorylase [Pseudomonadota bacterium]
MSQFDNVAVIKKANVYFDGKCVSHTVQFADGTRKSVGVILPTELPARLTFNTGVAEIMETVDGRCRALLKGETEWKEYGAGESFSVPGNSSFEIEVAAGEAYHYVCHFG